MSFNSVECARFDLYNGQVFGVHRLKNQQWFLNGEYFGFGDLRDADIQKIGDELKPGEIFEGFNEHHGSDFQQRDNPMVIVKKTDDGTIVTEFPKAVRVVREGA